MLSSNSMSALVKALTVMAEQSVTAELSFAGQCWELQA